MDMHDLINNYLERLKNGDKCFDEFYKSVSWCVTYIANRYLADKSFVEDVVINTFDRIANNIGSFNVGGNGYAWVCKIAQNESLNINRRESRPEVTLNSLEQAAVAQPDISPEESLDLVRAIDELDKDAKALFESRFLHGKYIAEIAEEFHISVGTVNNRLNKIYKTLYKKLSER